MTIAPTPVDLSEAHPTANADVDPDAPVRVTARSAAEAV